MARRLREQVVGCCCFGTCSAGLRLRRAASYRSLYSCDVRWRIAAEHYRRVDVSRGLCMHRVAEGPRARHRDGQVCVWKDEGGLWKCRRIGGQGEKVVCVGAVRSWTTGRDGGHVGGCGGRGSEGPVFRGVVCICVIGACAHTCTRWRLDWIPARKCDAVACVVTVRASRTQKTDTDSARPFHRHAGRL